MRILERDRPLVETLLRTARSRDGRVDAVVQAAAARLDGTDDLLVLCAIDDELARRLPEAEHPLSRPFAAARPTAPGPGDGPSQDLAPLDQLRWPDGGRPGVERIARGLREWDLHARSHLDACLAAVRVGPMGRSAMQRRASRLATWPAEVEAAEDLVAAVRRFAEAHGGPTGPGERLALDPPDPAPLTAIARNPTELEWARRRWLVAAASEIEREPHRLRVRSREACEVVGVAPPFQLQGPACLVDALLAWRRRFGSPHDLDRLEADVLRLRLALTAWILGAIEDAHAALWGGAGTFRGAGGAGENPVALLDATLAAVFGGPSAIDRASVRSRIVLGRLSPESVAVAVRRLSEVAAYPLLPSRIRAAAGIRDLLRPVAAGEQDEEARWLG